MARAPLIAIVDDDDLVRSSMASLVRSLGLAACTFASADDYFSSADRDAVCIISDVHMQGMSGIQLQRKLAESGSRIPVIMMTSAADEQIEVEAMAAGAASFFPKPVDVDRLIECLEGIVGKLEN